ncbi:MAG: alkene reductase [Candidatus Melainabacteria bacterium]|nr:alkene reductase [Candidatus Melainabacteria bacterium]
MALFQPFQLGHLYLPNRVVMAPMTRGRAGSSRVPNALMAAYYAQRAEAGLMITEATSISEQGLGWVDSPGIYTQAQAEGWQTVVQAVHNQGGRIFLQLWHCGRASHTEFHPAQGLPVSASAIAIQGDAIHTPSGKKPYETPRALETDEIPAIVEDYRQAAVRAKAAGFNGVEIHSANGYLLDQFLQDKTNRRTDRYGGSIENRCRLLLEVVEAVQTVWPAGQVGVRISPNGVFNDMGDSDARALFFYLAAQLNPYRLAYLHVMDGLGFGFHGNGTPIGLGEFRAYFTGTLIGNVGYAQAEAEERLRGGDADLIAFGRPFITNPDLVTRFRHGLPLNDYSDMRHWYTPGSVGYTDYAKAEVPVGV